MTLLQIGEKIRSKLVNINFPIFKYTLVYLVITWFNKNFVYDKGRAWKLDELRVKSNSDLHKLWYVLLKELNMLLTMQEESKRLKKLFPSPERIEKVEESMKNLENVVRERNRSYLQLEVSEEETGDRPFAFRRDMFGRYRW